MIIDISDQFCNFARKGKQRITYYKKHKYTIEKYDVDDNTSGAATTVESKLNDNKKVKQEIVTYNF